MKINEVLEGADFLGYKFDAPRKTIKRRKLDKRYRRRDRTEPK